MRASARLGLWPLNDGKTYQEQGLLKDILPTLLIPVFRCLCLRHFVTVEVIMGCTCSKQPNRAGPQVADEERRPSVMMKLFSRKKTMAVEANLEPAVSQAEFFNQMVNVGESETGTSPTPSDLEEVQSTHTGEITPVVLRSQLDVLENNEPPDEPPEDAIPAEEPPAEELSIDEIPEE